MLILELFGVGGAVPPYIPTALKLLDQRYDILPAINL